MDVLKGVIQIKMIFDGLFNKKKADEVSENQAVPEEKKTIISDAAADALNTILPKLEGNPERLEECYAPQEFMEAISGAPYDKLFILSEFLFAFSKEQQEAGKEGAEKYAGASAMVYGEISKKLQSAEEIYVIMDNCLKMEYPYIADGDALLFFDRTRAVQWCSILNNSVEKPLVVKTVPNTEIKNVLAMLAIVGAESIRFHPEINNIRIKRSDMFKCEVKTVADSRVRFLMLNYVQLMNSKTKKEQAKQAFAAVLGAISLDKFLLPGTEENGMFRSVTISDGEKVTWVPLFTDELEYRRFLDTFPDIKEQFKNCSLRVVPFTALKSMFDAPELGGIVINPADVGLRIKPDNCKLMVQNAEKFLEAQKKNEAEKEENKAE